MSWSELLRSKRYRGWRLGERARRAFTHGVGLKFMSLVAAFAIWVFVNFGERESEAAFQVPIELRNMPANFMIVSPRVDFIDLRVRGPRTLLGRIDGERLAIVLDVSGVRPGPTVFRVHPDTLSLPRGVSVVRLAPSEITFEWAQTASKTVPVKLQLVGKPPNDLRLTDTRVAPESVKVFGPDYEVRRINVVRTEPLDLANASAGLMERNLTLAMPPEYVSYSAMLVRVQVRLEEPEESRVLKGIPVVVRNAAHRAVLQPASVSVTVSGPRSKVRSLELADGAIYIDAAGLSPGDYQRAPAADLPADLVLVKLEPPRIRLRLRRKAEG